MNAFWRVTGLEAELFHTKIASRKTTLLSIFLWDMQYKKLYVVFAKQREVTIKRLENWREKYQI